MKNKIGLRIVLFLVVFSKISFASISIQSNTKSVEIGEEFLLTVKIDTKYKLTRNIEIPGIKNFTVIGVSEGMESRSINGVNSSYRKMFFTLEGAKKGLYKIGPLIIKSSGKTISSNSIQVNIFENKAQNSKFPDYLLKSELNKREVYINEQVIYKLKFYFRERFSNPRLSWPDFKDFWQEKEPEERNKEETINGISYNVKELRISIYPQKSGAINIPEASLYYEIFRKNTNGSSGRVFDPFFQSSRAVKKRLRSNEVYLKVLPISGNDLQSPYSGTLELAQNKIPSTIKAGDSLNLRFILKGNGNIRDLTLPALESKYFNIYKDKPEYKFERNKLGEIIGTKEFKFALVALNPGDISIPNIKFNYFDTQTKKIKTIESNFTKIKIVGSQGISSGTTNIDHSSSSSENKKNKIEILNSDIRPIHISDDLEFSNKEKKDPDWYLIVIGLCFITIVTIKLFYYKNENIYRYHQFRNKKFAMQQAIKEIESLKEEDFTPRIVNVLKSFLEKRMDINLSAHTFSEIIHKLESFKINKEVLIDLKDHFECSEQSLYQNQSKGFNTTISKKTLINLIHSLNKKVG